MNEPLATNIELSTFSTMTIQLITSCTIEIFIFDDFLFLKKIGGVLFDANWKARLYLQ